MASVLAIVVTYNRKELLCENLKALAEQTYIDFDVLVIDNNSTDGTEEAINDFDIIYEKLPNNIGGAGGFNYGMRYAAEHNYDYCWIMDDDTLPSSSALAELVMTSKALNDEYGWLSSKVLWTDGSICPMNIQRKTPYLDISFGKGLISSVMASFVSLFIKTETIISFGLPIKEFFIWSDDWEYTRRISMEKRCYTVESSTVIHAMKNNTVVNIATDTSDRLYRYSYFYRNDVFLYRREGIRGWIWLVIKDLWHSLQVCLKSKSLKKERLSLIWNGFRQGISFMPEIEWV